MAEMMVERVAAAIEEISEGSLIEARAYARVAINAMHSAETRQLAQSFLDRNDEDWTWVDPEDIKRLARSVLGMDG